MLWLGYGAIMRRNWGLSWRFDKIIGESLSFYLFHFDFINVYMKSAYIQFLKAEAIFLTQSRFYIIYDNLDKYQRQIVLWFDFERDSIDLFACRVSISLLIRIPSCLSFFNLFVRINLSKSDLKALFFFPYSWLTKMLF